MTVLVRYTYKVNGSYLEWLIELWRNGDIGGERH
jgi:hypothetical protein